MIVVDTSAILEIAFVQSRSAACSDPIAQEDRLLLSAGTLAETLIVAGRRGIADEVRALLDDLGLEVAPVTEAQARAAADAYRHYGKDFHPAALNYGDCFAYALAKERDCPLLFVGEDFAQTDIGNALEEMAPRA